MRFYEKFFGEAMVDLGNGEMNVRCPFPHTDERSGQTYYERRPSAHINENSGFFHCKACGKGHSEATFLADIEGTTYKDAVRMLDRMEGSITGWDVFHNNLKKSPEKMQQVEDLGISAVADELQLGYQGVGIAFPVFVYGDLLDIRTYNPNGKPKVKGEPGSETLILPYDLWREDDRDTVLCAGEKDMAIARAYGFNAITFTGGEGSFPKLFKKQFEGRNVFIAYDNDFAGIEGSYKVAMHLKDAGATPYIVDLSPVCKEKGEDIHDFFMKYKQDSDALIELTNQAEVFTDDMFNNERNRHYPLVFLEEAMGGQFTNRVISSRVAVVAEYEEAMEVPEIVTFEKFNESEKCDMHMGESREWYLDHHNIQDVLKLCDNNLKESEIRKNLMIMAGIDPKEKFIRMTMKVKTSVFKAVVTDDYESELVEDGAEDYKPSELVIYSLGKKLHNGAKYRLFYKRFPHPMQGQRIVGIATDVEDSDNSINMFQVTDSVKESMAHFQTDNVPEKMKEIYERSKAFCGAETRKDILWFIDLFYHTPLKFKFANRIERGYLDLMLIGESRTGKSQIAKKLLDMYELGVFTSLKTSTKAGLIGGSDKTSGGLKTKLGLIPRNHKGAVIMEEFSGGGQEIANALTEVRSSNKVRITRVNGQTTVDAMVRMMAISNQAKSSDGSSIPIRQYPNGVHVIQELIGAAEDIARYDLFLLVGEPDTYTRPNERIELDAFPKQAYIDRVRWIWSRKPEQIIIDERSQNLILDIADSLNEQFNTHIKFFGSEAWKKLARIAVAVAASVCSTDETYENVIVKPEHIQWAKSFMIACYDNKLFRLRQYVAGIRQYSVVDEHSINAVQSLYNQHPTLVTQLSQASTVTQSELKNMGGLSGDDFAKIMKKLYEHRLIERRGDKIIPSERFRESLVQVEDHYLREVGVL